MCSNNQLRNRKGGRQYTLFATIIRLSHNIRNEEQYKKHLYSQSSHYRNYGQHSTATGMPHQVIANRHLPLPAKRTGDIGKSMMCALSCCSWGKIASNSKEIKPVALSMVELGLPGGISLAVSQHKIMKNFIILQKVFGRVWGYNLKHFWAWLCLTNAANLS